ncbi:response regulator [Lactobacillus sp. ESL0260]|uniref:response regulator n=1 Tax=Lactobacillus sp. ESL0260 TaxID=2069347 RepID=UPI000EFD64A7|nr:response regulator [Lactobacillus sp. ESL0260]RMC59997.1 response regulator [Lactobacillus sp. ESL0260]
MLTILIVEDDPMVSSINKQYLMRIIKPENLTVYQTATAKKALAITKKINPNLILLDVYLPKTSGTELLEQFIQHNLHPNVIMLSAAKDSTNINMALKYGVLDYLLKPFSFKRFKEAIEHFLKYNEVLQKNNTVSQGELDHIFITQDMNNLNDETGLPKGLSDFSLTKIKTAISQLAGEFSNQDVARQSKLSRITTKKYLDYLEKTGKLSTKVHYLKVGRPIKIYKLNK